MSSFFPIVIRTIILFVFTIICFRLMGYRSIGDMEPLDYVIVLGIGEIMGAPLADTDQFIGNAIFAIGTLTILQICVSYLTARIPTANKLIDGKPVPVIRNGKIIHNNLKKNRVSLSDLMEELRVKGMRDEKDIEIAYLEPSGRFSVIKKSETEPITPRYLGKEGSYLLIENGEINYHNWKISKVKTSKVIDYLDKEGIKTLAEVQTLIFKNGKFLLTKK